MEARADASLERLDSLLRRVWLECCGHMSAFRVGQSELPKRAKIGSTLRRKGLKFTYEYDFGSTMTLTGHVLGSRSGCLGRAGIRLLARNDAPEWMCEECSRPAAIVCPFCVYSGPCLFCEAHGPELRGSLAYHVRDDTVDADGSEENRHEGPCGRGVSTIMELDKCGHIEDNSPDG